MGLWILTLSRRGQIQSPAIFIRYIEDMLQIYTLNGEVMVIRPRKALIVVPGVVPPDQMALIMPYLPTDMAQNQRDKPRVEIQVTVPRDIATPLIDRMLQLTSLADECYRKYAFRLDHIWEIMMRSKVSSTLAVEEIAPEIFRKPNMSLITAPMMLCLHRVMLQDERFLIDSRFHRIAPRYRLLSQKQCDDRLTVTNWIRDYQEYQASDTTASFDGESDLEEASRRPDALYTFIRKAQTFIQKSREVRSLTPTGHLGLSKVHSSAENDFQQFRVESPRPFNRDDIKIIRCLSDWALTWKIPDFTGSASIGPAILRAIGMYEGLELDRSTGFLLLKELGIVTPWENGLIYRHEFPMPGLGVDPAFDEMQKLANPSNLVLKDSMKDLRKDWGDLPVFCVDSLDTVEVDDGVSWEAADNTSSWVHVHVANPSAFIDKDSAIARYAARLSSTIYLIERRHFMLESDLLRKHCSLAPGCPSITFSARMNLDGDILETKVTHGVLHNIRYLIPETIDRHLYEEALTPEKLLTITVGGNRPTKSHGEDQLLTETEIEALTRLRELGSARRLNRNAKLSFNVDFPEPHVDLGNNHSAFGIVYNHSRCFMRDPLIAMPIQPYDPVSQPPLTRCSTKFVGDLMLLGGEVAAKWAAERGIPIAYTGTVGDPKLNTERETFERDIMQPTLEENGFVSRQHIQHYIRLSGHSASSPVPLRHQFLNLPVYCKATSPLRRYGDLFTHWQIDAAVRYEANRGVSLIGNTEDHFLPFSRSEAAEVLKDCDMAHHNAEIVTKKSRAHWTAQWFHRAYYHEALLPKTLTGYVSKSGSVGIDSSKNSGHCVGVIRELGVICKLVHNAATRAEGGLREGDSWEIEIEGVDIYTSRIFANPVRLIEKSPIQLYPRMLS